MPSVPPKDSQLKGAIGVSDCGLLVFQHGQKGIQSCDHNLASALLCENNSNNCYYCHHCRIALGIENHSEHRYRQSHHHRQHHLQCQRQIHQIESSIDESPSDIPPFSNANDNAPVKTEARVRGRRDEVTHKSRVFIKPATKRAGKLSAIQNSIFEPSLPGPSFRKTTKQTQGDLYNESTNNKSHLKLSSSSCYRITPCSSPCYSKASSGFTNPCSVYSCQSHLSAPRKRISSIYQSNSSNSMANTSSSKRQRARSRKGSGSSQRKRKKSGRTYKASSRASCKSCSSSLTQGHLSEHSASRKSGAGWFSKVSNLWSARAASLSALTSGAKKERALSSASSGTSLSADSYSPSLVSMFSARSLRRSRSKRRTETPSSTITSASRPRKRGRPKRGQSKRDRSSAVCIVM